MFSRNIRSLLTTQSRRTIHNSAACSTKHTPDTYNKDVDPTPPIDSSIYRVDPSSENVQKPHEAPSGQWSRAGVRTSDYLSKMESRNVAHTSNSEQLSGAKESKGEREAR
ncbi:hypothetical protein H0H81_011781 [Sphagnurus paluster]|uniref:Uncharacterized protein n=1 Tax=Sphagnurus paluster TaxID=117069 RepID=A0A9P7FQT1_9AGAR|nr:hypothetical protein H0H81_011781 [Sphagnurus paluster]